MPALIIGGPTGAGKTKLAIELSQAYQAPILSADAMTVFKGLDIGTAKPTPTERCMAKHYGIDIRDIDEDFSVSDFCQLADKLISTHKRVIIAGGTPFYLSALLNPMPQMPSADPDIRAKVDAMDSPHAFLGQVDPEMHAKLHPNDAIRITRALEVYFITGRPMSEVQKDTPKRDPLNAEIIWLDRENLRIRLNDRLKEMLRLGYVDECLQLKKRGLNRQLKPLKSFSYRYMMQHVYEEIDLDKAMELTEFGTWKLVRKQRTWARGMGWKSMTPKEAVQKAHNYFQNTKQ